MGGQGFRVFAAIRYDVLAGPRLLDEAVHHRLFGATQRFCPQLGKKQLGRAGKALGVGKISGATPLTIYIYTYMLSIC